MSTTTGQTTNLQIKLSLDEGLQNIWKYLSKEYEGLDKASIVRLALSTLAKFTKRQELYDEDMLFSYLDELDKTGQGMTEEDFFKWWNENKATL